MSWLTDALRKERSLLSSFLEMLKKVNRINKTRELQKVYRLGKTIHTPALVIKFLAGEKLRTAFVVSKKVSKKAVERNRIKRALREEMRLSLSNTSAGDYMIIAKGQASGYSNKDLRDQLSSGLKKGDLWQE
jgi:ribonuclease P protein component